MLPSTFPLCLGLPRRFLQVVPLFRRICPSDRSLLKQGSYPFCGFLGSLVCLVGMLRAGELGCLVWPACVMSMAVGSGLIQYPAIPPYSQTPSPRNN